MNDTDSVIHIRIRDLRRNKSITQEELASALGISRQSVNAMEAGRCLPSLPVAMQLASFFSVPLPEILSEVEAIEEELSTSLVPWSTSRDSWYDLPHMAPPLVNLKITEKQLIIECSLAGYAKEEIELEVAEEFIKIQAVIAEEEVGYYAKEFSHRSFQRIIPLPVDVHTDSAEAKMEQGVLTISLQRVLQEQIKTTKISIK